MLHAFCCIAGRRIARLSFRSLLSPHVSPASNRLVVVVVVVVAVSLSFYLSVCVCGWVISFPFHAQS